MQLSITITDQSRPGVELTSLPPMHAGETLKISFATWLNPDGTTRNMSGASVALKLYKLPARDLITITGATVTTSSALIPASSTTTWTAGAYELEIWETRGDASVNVGSVALRVIA